MCFETTEREREGKRDLLKTFREKRERNKEKKRGKTCYMLENMGEKTCPLPPEWCGERNGSL